MDSEFGVKVSTLDSRNLTFGDHKKERPTRTPFCDLVKASLEDFMLQVLLVCAFFSIVVEMVFADKEHKKTAWIEGFAIFVAVAVVSLVTAVSDYKKEGQFLAQLGKELDSQVVSIFTRFRPFLFEFCKLIRSYNIILRFNLFEFKILTFILNR